MRASTLRAAIKTSSQGQSQVLPLPVDL